MIVPWQFWQDDGRSEQVWEVSSEITLVGDILGRQDKAPIIRLIAEALIEQRVRWKSNRVGLTRRCVVHINNTSTDRNAVTKVVGGRH